MAFLCLPTHNKSTENSAAQALLHARCPQDLQIVVRLSQSCIFAALVTRTTYKVDCDLMQRGWLLDTINQPFLPHISTVTEQLLEIATRACFRRDQVFPHCTARQAAAPASPKPTQVRQHPPCSHLPKASVLTVCCSKSPPRAHVLFLSLPHSPLIFPHFIA